MNIIEENSAIIAQLCRTFHVEKLFLFGSSLSDSFDKDSDIDLIVRFKKLEIKDYADNYFELKELLEQLFQREIDLLEEQAIKNPYLRKEIFSKRREVYG